MNQPSFWVVETARSTYWDGRFTKEAAQFSDVIGDALKFFSFDDAERARCWLLKPHQQTLRSVEHMMFVEKVAHPLTGVRA